MKKISILLILTLFIFGALAQTPCSANVFTDYKIKTEQKKIYKSNVKDIKTVIELQDKYANSQNFEGLDKLYSKDFVNSDGFDKTAYFDLIKETWETYPDIVYKTDISDIEFNDKYATVFVNETATATSTEVIGDYETLGDLQSHSKCVYHLEKQGLSWIITSESIIEETSSLRYGAARFVDMELSAPKQIGAKQTYTAILKVDVPKDASVVGSITKESIIHPQTKSADVFRKVRDNTLERVFTANSANVNEYAVASVGITYTQNYDANHIRFYMNGMAFIMTRVNVIPENKFIKTEGK